MTQTSRHKRIMKKIALILLASVTLFGAVRANAASIAAVQTTDGTAIDWRNIIGANQSATSGWSFKIGAQDVELDAFGLFDLDGDGLESAHAVGIWNNGGTLLAQVTIPSGTGG